MTTERLIELNRSGYLTTNRFNRADLEIVQNTLDKLAFHHGLSDGPQPGDIVEGAYYDGAFPYKDGRLTEVGGGKITVCCHAYTPFVSFTAKGKPVLSTSGGPFMSHDIGELEPAGTEKACYKVWGCYGPCANGAISVETTVRRWRIPYERRPLSYITVLLRNDKEKTITVFRPNPNSKQVYDPMNQKEKMAYTRVHGEAGPVPVSIKETVTITEPVYVI